MYAALRPQYLSNIGGCDGTRKRKEQTAEEMWSALSMNKKIEALQYMGEGEDRQKFFNSLPVEEQKEIVDYLTKSLQERQDKAYEECEDMMEIIISADLDCMLYSSIVLDLYENKMKGKLERQNITKEAKYKFTLPKFIKGLEKEMQKLRPWCKQKESGVMTQLMTSAIPSFRKEYENVGMFFNMVDSKYPQMMKKSTDKLYVVFAKYSSRFGNGHEDIATCAILIETFVQAMSKRIDQANAELTAIRDEEKLKEEWRKSCAEAKRLGVKAPKWKPLYKLTKDIPDNIAFYCEKIATAILDKSALDKSNIGTLRNAYASWHKVFSDESMFGKSLDESIMYTIMSYTQFYFAKMVDIVKRGADMPKSVKDDMNFLFQSKTGYCRVMKDIRKFAKLVTSDDLDDFQDELIELSEKHNLKTFKEAVQRVKRMRTDDSTYDEKFLKNIYEKALKEAKKGIRQAL